MHAKVLAVIALFIMLAAAALAQQPVDQLPPEPPTRVEAKKQVIVNWSLNDQAWEFKEIQAVYEPVKGFLEVRGSAGPPQAVWTLRLAKDLEQGTVDLHQNQPGSPFRVVFLDADRTLIVPDKPPAIRFTPITGKLGDSITLAVELPPAPLLSDVKFVRIERRTNVGF